MGCRFEAAARAAIVGLAGIPVAVVGFRRAGIHNAQELK